MAPLESSRRFLSFEWVEGTHLLWTGGRTHKSTFINMTHFRIQQLEVVTPIPDFVWRLAEALPRNQILFFVRSSLSTQPCTSRFPTKVQPAVRRQDLWLEEGPRKMLNDVVLQVPTGQPWSNRGPTVVGPWSVTLCTW